MILMIIEVRCFYYYSTYLGTCGSRALELNFLSAASEWVAGLVDRISIRHGMAWRALSCMSGAGMHSRV